MKLQRSDAWLAVATAWLAFACGGSNGGGTGPCTPGLATQLVKNGGDPTWYVNNPLPAPLGVTARDANGCAVPGTVVNWSITTGGGGLSAAQVTTNAAGIASVSDSLGGATTQIVTAASAGTNSTVFNVTGMTPPTAADVSVGNNFFSPADTAVKVGGTGTWTWNSGGTTHTLTFTSGPPPLPGETVQAMGTKVITFNTAGTYGYHCTIHAGMTGTLRVVH
jgi:plastocyanin